MLRKRKRPLENVSGVHPPNVLDSFRGDKQAATVVHTNQPHHRDSLSVSSETPSDDPCDDTDDLIPENAACQLFEEHLLHPKTNRGKRSLDRGTHQ